MENKECVFCKIINGEIKQDFLYEDNKTVAILDINPAQPKGGHTLVIPRSHYEILTDISDEDVKALMLTIKKISKALLNFGDGLNIIQNNKKIAGQFVPHVHFHLIPRFANDGIIISEKWPSYKYKDNEIEETLKNIKKFID